MASVATSAKRARLDQESVLVAAEALVDVHGIDDVTMTMLASELGTKVSSLYNHVASLEELRSTLQVRAMELLGVTISRAAMGNAGEDGLRKLAEAFLGFARQYPRRYDTMTRTIHDRARFFRASARAVDGLVAMIGSTGIEEKDALRAQMAFFAALHGFASLETSGFFAPLESLNTIDLDGVYAQVVTGAVSAMLAEN